MAGTIEVDGIIISVLFSMFVSIASFFHAFGL
jgi:hypothetical protein